MKFIRFLVFSLFLVPVASWGASSDFMMAAQLLAAAKSADIQQVQSLVNSGANINFVDSTGVSIVCTALMNNDVRAAQILQMYGADASKCDRQIKQYKNRTKPKESGGLFGGLSTAQTISLAAAGAAVVVGGLFLLTDVFDPGNDNDSGASGGDRPNNNPGGGNVPENADKAFALLPMGPACDPKTGVCGDVDAWSPDTDTVRAWDFAYIKDFNYLMMSYAYNAFARGYMGMDTIRIGSDKTPFDLSALPFVEGAIPGGGRPVTVATVTANGVNPSGSLVDGWLEWADATLISNAQKQCSQYGSTSAQCTNAMTNLVQRSRKFYNYQSLDDLGDLAEKSGFDFSGDGTVFGNATDVETYMAKVVAGWEYGGRATGDAYGFVPNGQLAVYRTGGGLAYDDVVGSVTNAENATGWATDDKFTVDGVTYKLVVGENNVVTAVNVGDSADVLDVTVRGDTLAFEIGDTQYAAEFNGVVNSLKVIDYKNYDAMLAALKLSNAGQSVVSVIANIEQNPASTSASYLNMRDFKSLAAETTTDAMQRALYAGVINQYYNLDTTDDKTVGTVGDVADALYKNMGNYQTAILVNSVGSYEYGIGDGKSIAVLDPTFENYAPALYPDMEHLFMSVVAVGNKNGTGSVSNISDYTGADSATGKLVLSKWGTGYNAETKEYENIYSSRKCGAAGVGLNGIDPWCFAAPGINSEMAVASMAGAVASVQSAFSYLSNQEIFALIALTSDGAYLGTNPNNSQAWANTTELVSYLQGRYELPGEYSYETDAEYLAAFKDVFGYGMINVERATRPGKTIYYFDGNNIVSADGNAYWRGATNTVFRPSSVLNLRGATIRAPFYDLLESADGEMSMPRVWENEFAFGANDKRALYMGDVLGEMTTRRDTAHRQMYGNIGVSMSLTERAYADNLSGLDNLSLDYVAGDWKFGASYQRYLTDGASRFSGLANPVLGLASNAVVTDVAHTMGKWSFGARVFSGAVTDEGLLENDPTISSQYMPARLGLMQGAQSHVAWGDDKLSVMASIGNAHETGTLLGAQSGGLLDFGAGDTMYVDAVAKYKFSDVFDVMARATFAQTSAQAGGAYILGLTDIKSNAFAIGANIGNLEFSVSQPLAITDGALQYAYADYDVVKIADNKYELNVVDTRVIDLDLTPEKRELRFAGTYRHAFGEFTDGAFGFIYRVNPNNTDDFGNESIFMLKLSHRLGI